MMLFLLLSLFSSLFTGFLIISLLWPDKLLVKSNLLIKICLSVGLGFGISSCVFFLWLVVFGPSNGFIRIEILLLICLGAIFLYRLKRKPYSVSESYSKSTPKSNINPSTKLRINSEQSRTITRILSIAFYVSFASAVISFISLSLRNPHGGWDAWAAWNTVARFIFRGGEYWKDVFYGFSKGGVGADNPLLLPASIIRCWKYIGMESVLVQVLIAIFFTFATVGLIFSFLTILRGKSQGYLAGLTLLGTSFFILHGAHQYADAPSAFFLLATLVLLSLRDRLFKRNCSLLFLAGMMAGLSGWTKHEGLLFLTFVTVTYFAVTSITKGWKNSIREIFFFMLGILPILAIIVYFKTQIVVQNPFVQTLKMTNLTDISRYVLILRFFGRKVINFGNGIIGIIPLLAFYFFLLGIGIKKEDASIIIVSFITILFMLGGYLFMGITTANIIHFVVNSIDRVFMQLWPSFIFVYFMTVKTPEEFMAGIKR